jgi:hypothetical protein
MLHLGSKKLLLSAVISSLMLAACGGDDGKDGSAGAAGAAGTNGSNGTNGLTSLTNMKTLTAGTECQYGGVAVQVGLDDNKNGVLDQAEVDSEANLCNGKAAPSLMPANTQLVFEGVAAPATNMIFWFHP